MSAGESGVTVQQFYTEKILNELQKRQVADDEMQLQFALLGKSKELLELSLPLDAAIQPFGPFCGI